MRIVATDRHMSCSLNARMQGPAWPRFSPLGWVLKSSDESGQAMLDFDFGRAGPERLTIQVGKDQAHLGAERQTQLDPPVGFRVTSYPCLDTQCNVALLPFPNPYLIPRFTRVRAAFFRLIVRTG